MPTITVMKTYSTSCDMCGQFIDVEDIKDLKEFKVYLRDIWWSVSNERILCPECKTKVRPGKCRTMT